MATVATAKTEFEVSDKALTNSSTTTKLLQLHQDGTPFVMPSKRGMDPRAPGFDTQGFMDLLTEDMMYIQHAKLREILEVQGEVEYLQSHGLDGRTDVESFRKCLPVVNYSDLEGDIMRLVNGEKSGIFTVDPISNFSFSSGTTGGKPKFISDTARSVEDFPFIKAYELALIRRFLQVPLLNDVIRVKSFRKTVPVFEYVRRKNVLLSVYVDKTDEKELQAVVNKSTELLKGTAMELSDYISTADFTSLPGGYRIFWEMTHSSYGSNLDHNVLQECANILDQSFNDEYRRWRKATQLRP